MSLKPDKFTWIVIAIVVALLVAAVITVNRSGVDTEPALTYRTDDAPDTPVYNAFVATELGETFNARKQYSSTVLEQIKRDGYDPFSSGYRGGDMSRQLRIIAVDVDENDPNHGVVTVIEDNYSPSGPFGSGNTWSNRRVIPVVREEGVWKIDAAEYF